MVLNKLTNRKSEKGFTLVELLIVIVVIAILAAITIVAYSGITARANASKTLANVDSVQKVAESYNADNGYYPDTIAHLTSGTPDSSAPGTTHLPTGIVISTSTSTTALTAANGTYTFKYNICGTASGTDPAPTGSAVLGGEIIFHDYNTGSDGTSPTLLGTAASSVANSSTPNCAKWYPVTS